MGAIRITSPSFFFFSSMHVDESDQGAFSTEPATLCSGMLGERCDLHR